MSIVLPNRDLFRDRIYQALARAERHRSLVAVMFLDLDRQLKPIAYANYRMGDILTGY